MAGLGRGSTHSAGASENAGERLLLGLAPPKERHAVPEPQNPVLPRDTPGNIAPPFPEAIDRGKARRRRFSVAALPGRIVAASITELDRGVVFLLVPVFLAIGVALYFSLDAEPGFLQPAALVCALAGVAYLARSRPLPYLCLAAALLCALGFLAAKAETWRAGTRTIGSEISTRLTGRVVSVDQMETGRVRLTLDVLSTARPTLRYAPTRVRLSARAIPQGVTAGSVLNGYVRLLPPTGPVRPGSYDFSFQSYFDGIGASGFFLSNPKRVSSATMPVSARVGSAIENAREAIAGRIRESVGGPEGEIAAALIVGVRAGIPNAINEAMRKTGIYHIISISGLHMALVAGTIMLLLRGGFALFPDFSSRRPVKKYAAAAALFSIAAYLAISGVVVAAERSFIMLAVMLLAVLFDRAALTMRNLAISAIAVIVVSPHEVVGPSFQMSFAATAALVGAYAGWSDYRSGRAGGQVPPRRSFAGFLSRKFLAGTAGLAMTSIIAGSATTLYAMWHFQRVAPLSLFANLAVMPIVSVVVMPFAVLASLAMPFGADGPFLYVMGRGLAAMIVISDWIAARSPIDAVGLVSVHSVLFITAALVFATMATTWLRLAALPLAIAGLLSVPMVKTPDMLVSEDGRLVAVPIGGGELAVNRPRPNAFTIDNWRRALNAETVVKPEKVHTIGVENAGAKNTSGKNTSGKNTGGKNTGGKNTGAKTVKAESMRAKDTGGKTVEFNLEDSMELPPGTPFLCADDLCVARHEAGPLVAYAQDAKAAGPACAFASVIVIDDAAASDPCRDPLVAVVTKRQLARSGSAEIFFDRKSAVAPAEIRFAVEEHYRPWHTQRKFSREARGLPPYKKAVRTRAKPTGTVTNDAEPVQ